MVQKVKFVDPIQSRFLSTVRTRVDAYFRDNQLSKHANAAMWAKAVFFLTGYGLLYGLILSDRFGVGVMLLLAILLGIFAACIGFNVSHDAIHGSFSASSRVNLLLSHSFYLLGANPYVWSITHNLVHHTYTNIPGHDEDLEVAPGLLRLCPRERWNPMHRYQHGYAFLLYGLASLSWVMRKDYVKFFQKRIGSHRQTHPRIEFIRLFFYKTLYYLLFLGLPIWLLSLAWWQVLVGFMVMHLAEGLVLGLVFQLAHVVEGTEFPVPNGQNRIEEAWAIHQLRTTANFAPDSRMADFLCGGLNRQIEHHLFAGICHIHYPAIAPIVRQTAREFGLPYLENPSFRSALASHYRLLRQLGRDEALIRQTVDAGNTLAR